MRMLTLIAASALALSLAAPAIAQDAMASDSAMKMAPMKMSAMDMKKMKKCEAMSHEMAMKNAGCVKLMKMHSDAMSGDSMMSGH